MNLIKFSPFAKVAFGDNVFHKTFGAGTSSMKGLFLFLNVTMAFLVVLILYSLVLSCKGQTGDDVKNLITNLFTTNDYKKNVRPNLNQTQPMNVYVDLFLVGINGIDDITQKLTTTGFLYIEWVDEYLKWDPKLHGGVFNLHVSQGDIWKPDIALQNGFSKLKELGNNFINVQILYTGDVTWIPSEVLETKCNIDIRYFPFDRQICEIVFVVWSNSLYDVKVIKGTNGIILENLDPNGVWSVVSTAAYEDIKTSESRVVFKIELKRNSSYYVLNVIVPVIFLGILNVFTFLIPAESGEKMGYAITVFLSFAVFMTIIVSELPKSSGSILEYYLTFQLCLGTFIISITACELRLYHRGDSNLFKFCGCCRRRKTLHLNRTVNTTQNSIANPTHREKSWGQIVSATDLVLFFVTVMLEFIATIVMILILYTKYQ